MNIMKLNFINRSSIYYLFLIIFVILFFWFDRYQITGTDNAWYLDIAYLLNNKQKFLVDFYDYRIPIFSYFVSFVYHLKLSEINNVYIVIIVTFLLYMSLIYWVSNIITKSHFKSFCISLICFLSISSRNFDAARNITQPLFHHSLELISIILVWKIFINQQINENKINILNSYFAGLTFMLSFTGRQVFIFPVILFFILLLISYVKNLESKQYLYKYFISYIIGVITILLFTNCMILKFWNGDWATINYWLFKVPFNLHNTQTGKLIFIKNPYGIFKSMLGLQLGFKLPIISFFYLLIIYKFLGIKKDYNYKNFKTESIQLFQKDVKVLLLLFFILIAFVFSVISTGSNAPRYQTGIFSIFSILLAITLNYISYEKKYFFLIALSMIFFFIGEKYHYENLFKQKNKILFSEKLALELKKICKPNEVVLVLGGQSIVGRVVGYKPFMGYLSDVLLFSSSKLSNSNFDKELIENISSVNIIYKLPDYPNLRILGLDSSNSSFKIIEYKLTRDFEIIKKINGKNSYPYNFNTSAIIYKRKNYEY
jgi:hypothetical protein